tara:strand:- start:34883 stop:35605 length:723 start_codon:yes stop_codon:yes gene_type:complete
MNKKIALITWTHNEYRDLWPMYFGRLDKHLNYNKSYIFLDKYSEKINKQHQQLVNNDKDLIYKRLLECLDRVEEKYVLYSQEDHIFYGDCNEEQLEYAFNFLVDSSLSSIRLIKSGEMGGNKIGENIFLISQTSPYLFSQQSSIWKKDNLKNLIKFFKPKTYRDMEGFGSIAMKSLKMGACYYYSGEPKRGSLHFDSSIFPYIATAVCKGRWNLKQYPELLKGALTEYKVDPTLRGIYEI